MVGEETVLLFRNYLLLLSLLIDDEKYRVLEARAYIRKGYTVKTYDNRQVVCKEWIEGYNDLQEEVEDCYREDEIRSNIFTLDRK